MTITKTELDHSLELFYLRTRLTELEKLIEEEKSAVLNVPLSFHVVLKVTTLPYSWENNCVDSGEIKDLFMFNLEGIKGALRLIDDGDSVEVESVTEITHEHT